MALLDINLGMAMQKTNSKIIKLLMGAKKGLRKIFISN